MADIWDLAPPAGTSIWDTAPIVGGTVPSPQAADDIASKIMSGLKSFKAGTEESATMMAVRGKTPEHPLPENAPWYDRLGAKAGAIAADLPLSGVGAILGSRFGAPGAVAGGFAAPMALREALMDAYTNNYAMSWEGAWNIGLSALKGAAKGAAIGLATVGAGRAVAPFLGAGIVGGTAKFGAELAALTTASSAVELHMPTWQDFMDNAILLGGVKSAVHVAGIASGLRKTYAETGKTPVEVVAEAKTDPAIAEALVKGEIPEVYKPLALDERIKAAVGNDPRPESIRQIMGATEPPKLGEPPINDPIKYEYITDQDTLQGVLRITEQRYQPEIEAQTRGVVPNKETAAAALKLVATGDIAEHVVGTAENAAQIYARAHVLKGVTAHVKDSLDRIRGIPEADLTPAMKLESLAAIEQLSMVMSEFRGARAEAGRAMQIFQKIKKDNSVIGDAETILKLAERKGKLQDIAEMVSRYKDPAQMQTFAEGYAKATTLEKVLEAWKAGLVSGPQTHLANVMGNLGKWIVDVPESAISATITAASRAIKGDSLSMAQYKARALAPLYGLTMGAKDALLTAKEVAIGKGEHLEKGDIYRTAIEGTTGQIVRLPFRALQVEDVLFRTLAERAEAHTMAIDRVTKEGVLHPDTAEFREAIAQFTEHPGLGLSEKAGIDAINRVQQAGAEGVFSQRLGPRMETIQRALAGSPVQFVMPFFRTPVNLLSWAVQHTPVLNLLSGRWRSDFAAGGESRAKAIARVTVGSAIALTAYSLTKDGTITGGGLFDKEQGNTKRAAGWQPYSFLIDGKYYSYQRMEPVAKVIGIAADLIEMMAVTKDHDDLQKQALMLVALFGNATVSTTYMSGLSNTINGITDPTRYLPTLMEQYATSIVPRIVGQTASETDPYKREVDGVTEAIQSQIPFLREKLLPKRDVWGEPTQNNKWFDAMPVAVTEKSQDKVKTEAQRLGLAIVDAPKWVEEKGPFKGNEKRIDLTAEQRDIMREVTGKTAMTILAPIVNAPDWEQLPNYVQGAIYDKVLKGARKMGIYSALPSDDAARVIMRQKIVDEIIRQDTEAETSTKPAPRIVK